MNRPTHDEAVAIAAQVLAEHSFERDGVLEWSGTLETDHGGVRVCVRLPEQYPYRLPEIAVTRKGLRTRLPHVEESGKLCLVARNGIRVQFPIC